MPKLFSKSRKWNEIYISNYDPPLWNSAFDMDVWARYRPAGGDEEFDKKTFQTGGGVVLAKESVLVGTDSNSFCEGEFCVSVFQLKGDKQELKYKFKLDIGDVLLNKTDKIVLDSKNKKGGSLERKVIQQEVFGGNGPQFQSSEFWQLASEYDFQHTASKLRFPQSNGLVEKCGFMALQVRLTKFETKMLTKFNGFADMRFGITLGVSRFNPEVVKSGESSNARIICPLADCVFNMAPLLKDPGKVHTIEQELIGKRVLASVEMKYLYDKERPSLLDYRLGGLSVAIDCHADAKALACNKAFDLLRKFYFSQLECWRDTESELDRFIAKGSNFQELLEDTMNRAKKIEPGKAYMMFVYLLGSSKVKIDAEQIMQSSLLPMSIIIIRSNKNSKKQARQLFLHMDLVRDTIDNEETDFFEKKNKRRSNLFVGDFNAKEYKNGEDEFAPEDSGIPLHLAAQQMTEYFYLNDIKPCSPTH